MTARLQSRHYRTAIMIVYAPAEDANDADKDEFYHQFKDVLNSIPTSDATQETNDNGKRMLLLCNISRLCMGNTYFVHIKIHKKTWKSPDGNKENEINCICISRRWRSALKDIKVCRGADVGSDHHLLRGKIQFKLRKI